MTSVRELYSVMDLPVFQNLVYPTRHSARNCPRGDLTLVENLETGLVYNQTFRPELMNYDPNYQNEQANSPLFQEHLKQIVAIINRQMGHKNLVEVGCGKGRFLELLLHDGFDVCGYDPTYEGDNPRVKKTYFSADLGVRGDGLILRHVLEHIQDPVDFLQRLKDANGGGGKIYIEVPCFDWICQRRTWFDVFYEHVNYFCLSDFQRMFGTVYEAKRTFGEQYLSIVADLGSIRVPKRDPANPVAFPSDFTHRLQPRDFGRSAIWGGGSKGVLFSLLMERAGSAVELVIDINPAKQGRYLPVSGLEVLAPEKGLGQLSDGATIYVMNSNYLEEIREMSGNRFRYVAVDDE